jgi:hypothetical protein
MADQLRPNEGFDRDDNPERTERTDGLEGAGGMKGAGRTDGPGGAGRTAEPGGAERTDPLEGPERTDPLGASSPTEGSPFGDRPENHDPLNREGGSPLGTDPQEASPLPGDPREPQAPQEPRTTHVSPGRDADESSPARASGHDPDDSESDEGVVDHLRNAWDRMRGKK